MSHTSATRGASQILGVALSGLILRLGNIYAPLSVAAAVKSAYDNSL